MSFNVKWTGEYPVLCSGEWKAYKNGVDVSHLIPLSQRYSPMETYGTYQGWHFVDWIETFYEYEDGSKFPEWWNDNQEWASRFVDDCTTPEDIYNAFCKSDWRHGSCGGCI